jgi:hypothetical protein
MDLLKIFLKAKDYIQNHRNEHEKFLDSHLSLSDTDVLSLITQGKNGFSKLGPIGSRFLTRADIEYTVHAWRQKNKICQWPKGKSWLLKSDNWEDSPIFIELKIGPNFTSLDFSTRNLERIDLAGAILSYCNFENSNLEYSILREALLFRANLNKASVKFSDLSDAIFLEADLREAEFWKANLSGTSFFGSNLENSKLLDANLDGTYFYRARMNNTELSASQLGGSIGEERECMYGEAIEAYSRLKSNFESLGQYSDAGWAYRKERRMRKLWAKQQAIEALRRRRLWISIKYWLKWVSDWLVEILCDYGESTWRVIGWMAILVFIIGPTLIPLLGGLSWPTINRDIFFQLPTMWQRSAYIYIQYLLYMLDTVTTANYSDLEPRTDALRLVSGIMAMTGIFLVGLLGFVAGNRIRNS